MGQFKREIIKKGLRIFFVVFLLFLLLLIGGSQVLRLSKVQTFIAQKTTQWVNQNYNTKLNIEQVDWVFPFTLNLKNIFIQDHHEDTLIFAETLNLSLLQLKPDFSEIDINYLKVKNATFKLTHYQEDSLNNLMVFINKFSTSRESSSVQSPHIFAHVVQLNRVRFKYQNQRFSEIDSIIDFNHVNVNLTAAVEDFTFADNYILAEVNSLQLSEKKGFQVKDLQTELLVSSQQIYLRDLMVFTPQSRVEGSFSLLHHQWENYSDFLNKVDMKAHFNRGSVINFKDIGFFAEPFYSKGFPVNLYGELKGTVANLKTNNLFINFGKQSYFQADLKLMGLPDIYSTFYQSDFEKFEVYADDVNQLLQVFSPKTKIPKQVEQLNKIIFNGKLNGYLENLDLKGDLISDMGDLYADVNLKLKPDGSGRFGGHFRTVGLNLNRLTQSELLGEIAFNGDFKGRFDQDSLNLNINSFFPFIDFNGYRYNEVKVNGVVKNQSFQGVMNVYDENLKMAFTGKVDLNSIPANYTFSTSVSHANLSALNIINNNQENVVSGSFFVDLQGNNLNKLQGTAIVGNLVYQLDSVRHKLKSLKITSNQNDSIAVYNLASDNIDAELKGKIDFEKIFNHFNYEVYTALPYLYDKAPSKPSTVEDFTLDLKIHQPTFLSRVFYPEVEIYDEVWLNLKFKSNSQSLVAKLLTPKIGYKDFLASQSEVQLVLDNGVFDATINSGELKISDSLRFENMLIKAKSVGNNLQSDISWNTRTGTQFSGNVSSLVNFISPTRIVGNFFNTSFNIEGGQWSLNEANEIAYIDSNLYFKNLDITNGEQKFSVFGSINKNPEVPLNIAFEDFNLKTINDITKSETVRLGGSIDGIASLNNFYNSPIFSADFQAKDLMINQQDFGKGNIRATWNKTYQKITINGRLASKETEQVIDLKGDYFPFEETDALDITLQLKNVGLNFAQPFLANFISDFDGKTSGKVIAKGKPAAPLLTGKLNLINTKAKVDYLNSAYFIKNETLIIEPDWIGFNNITIEDERGEKAKSVGTIFHENYSNFNFDIFLYTTNFQMLNTNALQNNLYYGSAFAGGNINVSGYADNLTMDINVTSQKGTKLFIPLSGPYDVNTSSYITYVSSWDEIQQTEENGVDLSGIQMNFNLDVTEDAEIQLIFDETAGDIMRAKGKGTLQMKINTLGEFLMYGEYAVSEGDYLFTLENIINKKFRVKPGGTITWNGDPYDARLDLTAIYRTRASLIDLNLPIDSTAAKRKVPVEVDLAMKNNFLAPDLSFDIRLPNSDDNTQALMNSLIQTEEELNKQVFSLMIMNRFSPPQSGLQTGGAVGATSSELLANQLTNWLSKSKLNDIVEIGVSELSADEVQVALSKRFFNDRVVVEGNFGSTSPTSNEGVTETENNNIVGDFNVEYAIKKDGKLKARAYRKSNDFNMVNNNFSPYTEGIGVFYREDFDEWRGLWQKIVNKKKSN